MNAERTWMSHTFKVLSAEAVVKQPGTWLLRERPGESGQSVGEAILTWELTIMAQGAYLSPHHHELSVWRQCPLPSRHSKTRDHCQCQPVTNNHGHQNHKRVMPRGVAVAGGGGGGGGGGWGGRGWGAGGRLCELLSGGVLLTLVKSWPWLRR